ncbi:MAG: hypothetical protein KDK24_02710 [Pseudooceanicola sp.]|nr:hypothetical protein [Pseudooceanicola sp.]
MSALGNSGLSGKLFDKARLHFLASPDQPFDRTQLLAGRVDVRVFGRPQFLAHSLGILPDALHRSVQRLKQVGRIGNAFFRSFHGHFSGLDLSGLGSVRAK